MITDTPPIAQSVDAGPERRRRLGLALVCLWAFFLSVQLPALTEGQNLNLAISDLVLVAGLLTTFTSLRFRAGMWSVWHLAIPVVLTMSAVFVGPLTRYTVGNKVVGIAVLMASYLFVTSHLWSWEDIVGVVRAFYAGMVVLSGLGMIKYFLGIELPLTYCQLCDVRLIAFMPDANLYGSLLVVALAAFIALDGSRLPVVRGIWKWPSLLVLVGALALSSSRSAWLGMAAVVLVAFAMGRRRALPTLAGAAVAVTAVSFLLDTERVLAFLDLAGRTHSIESRFTLIDQGLAAFATSPLIGIGLGSSHEQFGQIIHNTLLWVAAELGVIGIVIFGGFLVWMGSRLVASFNEASRPYRPLVSFLILGNVGMLVFSFSVEAFYQRHWWMLFALTAAASVVAPGDDASRASVQPSRSVVGSD